MYRNTHRAQANKKALRRRRNLWLNKLTTTTTTNFPLILRHQRLLPMMMILHP